MLTLALDTATEILSIALARDHEVFAETIIEAGRSHLELLLPSVDSLLGSHDLNVSDIGAINVGTGPGTFSGLRVGVATARALAQALEVPLTGGSSLQALASGIAAWTRNQAGESPGAMLPVIDAKRGQVFAQLFESGKKGALCPTSEIMCLDPADLITVLGEDTGVPVVAAGNGVLTYWSVFESESRFVIPEKSDPAHTVRSAFHVRHGDPGDFDPRVLLDVVPVYVREPDADKTVLLRKREPWLE